MSVEWEHVEVTQSERIRREFQDRATAERAVERLHAAGFTDDQITLSTHGGKQLEDGTFQPGGLEVVVMADPERAREAERIIAED